MRFKVFGQNREDACIREAERHATCHRLLSSQRESLARVRLIGGCATLDTQCSPPRARTHVHAYISLNFAHSVKSNSLHIMGSIESTLDALKSQTDVNYTETARNQRNHAYNVDAAPQKNHGVANELKQITFNSTKEGAC